MMPNSRSLVVVSNTSPLFYATQIGQLELLRRMYETILIPEQVYNELVVRDSGLLTATQIPRANWIVRKSVKNRRFVARLERELDPGESEAIALATEVHSDLLLMDEQAGRKIAERERLKITGIIGVLVEAKKTKLLTEIKPLLQELFQNTNFRGKPKLYQQALALAGE